MSSHPDCNDGHVCARPSGRVCINDDCDQPAGTLWGPFWCPEHDKQRLDNISESLESMIADLQTRS